jgi:dUTP pyrophosphatase
MKHNVCLANGVGVIDSGYRGRIRAKLINLSDKPYTVHPGDRVCQLVIVPFATCSYTQVDELDETERGANGYGSTGVD